MAMDFATVEPVFQQLRDFVMTDLRQIAAQETGGNYAATALIGCACDALGRLTYGADNGGGRFFSEYVLPNPWKEVSGAIYGALRNGLVHLYDTKAIRVGKRTFEIAVSKRDKPHLTFSDDGNYLFVNVQDLVAALDAAFERIRERLVTDAAFRERFYMKAKEGLVIEPPKRELEGWRRLLATLPTSPAPS
jgi:hypothetical protein